MTPQIERLNLTVDLNGGVVPISKVASSLAALLRRAREQQRPIVVTQKGYPSGVILSIELYNQLCDHARTGEIESMRLLDPPSNGQELS